MEVRTWKAGDEEHYCELVNCSPYSMFTHSPKYLDFLLRVLGDNVTAHHIVAFDGSRMVAAMPAFVRKGPLGPVVNSLPFYGSHGGVVSAPGYELEAASVLTDAFERFCSEIEAFSSTIVEPPYRDPHSFRFNYQADYFDERIGQVSTLPHFSTPSEIQSQILENCHSHHRRVIRKCIKSNFELSKASTVEEFESVWKLHRENIQAIGGLAKPWSVFEAIQSIFKQHEDYELYLARSGGQVAAGLLLFYFRDTVEYFTPAISEDFRSQQPLSFLILHAMIEAVAQRQMRYWNWGGTWPTQAGVYSFKSRWGALDYPYRYYIRTRMARNDLMHLNSQELREQYPNFFTIPFGMLNAGV